jgi:(2R)-ethylmalonyl-CoA mutase
MQSDPRAEADQCARLTQWRTQRDSDTVSKALAALRQAAQTGANIMPASIACAKAGVTTGEWAAAMRGLYGEYRAPTGVSKNPSNRTEGLEPVRDAVAQVATKLGRPLRLLLGKPGLDGHSNGAEQIAARARDCGMEITYDGIRLTPQEIIAAATEKQPDVIGLSILSGSHLPLIRETLDLMRDAGLAQPLVVGGIIPDDDAKTLKAMGVAQVYTPKDFQLNRIMLDLVALADPAQIAAE